MMPSPLRGLPDRPLTVTEARALETNDALACPSLWIDRTVDGEEKVVAMLLIVERTLFEFVYDDGWSKRRFEDDITALESYTAIELAAHARLQDTLDVSEDRALELVRNEESRPAEATRD